MAFTLTLNAQLASKKTPIEPQLVLEIDGVSTHFGAIAILKYIKIGEDNLYIDNASGLPWYIGGFSLLNDQEDVISFDKGTTSRFSQQLQPDKGLGTSVSSLQVAMIDDGTISELISPGFVVTDILGRACKVQLGFNNTAYPDDYVSVFRGVIEDVNSEPGLIILSIASTEQKKRQSIFTRVTTKLDGAINDTATTITLDSTTGFRTPQLGPDGLYDSTISFYVQIDNELIKYTGVSGNSITGCVRGQLGTTAVGHSDEANVSTVTRLQGNGVILAQKLMLSGVNGAFATGVEIEHFNYISALETVPNSIFFFGVDVEETYGLFAGDYLTTTGASNGANNVTAKTIDSIVKTNDGSYIVVDGVTFVNEANTSATISFRSQFDTLGYGMKMYPRDVDVKEHDRIYRLFLSSFDFDFRLKEGVIGKDFVDDQIYKPMSSFSVPRKGRSSMNIHIGPVPTTYIPTLDQTNIVNPDSLRLKRSLARNFNNTVTVEYDKNVLTEKYDVLKSFDDGASKTDIPVGDRTFAIKSDGMRALLAAESKATQVATRLLNRYKRGAEYIDNVEILFDVGFTIEIGDLVLMDTSSLQMTDTRSGTRGGTTRYFEVVNKVTDLKQGKTFVNLVDTNFSTANRYCLIGPSSRISSGVSGTQFSIYTYFNDDIFGINEGLKWSRYGQINVRVHNGTFLLRDATKEISSVSGNTITLGSTLGFTAQLDDVLDLPSYNDSSDSTKQVYGYMTNSSTFSDGRAQFKML